MGGQEGADIQVEQRVAVHHQEARLQPVEAGQHRAGGAARIAVVDQHHAAAEVAAGQVSLDLVGGVVDQHHRLLHPLLRQLGELAGEQRDAVDIDQRLRPAIQAGGQAGTLAAGEDDRLHQPVPSCDNPASGTPSCAAISATARAMAASEPCRGVQPSASSRLTS
jgi:hypothetical protein